MNESKLLAKIQATHPDIVNQVISEAEAELTAAQSQLESAQSGFQGAQSALTEAQTRFATAQADHADLTGTTYATTAQPLIVPINE